MNKKSVTNYHLSNYPYCSEMAAILPIWSKNQLNPSIKDNFWFPVSTSLGAPEECLDRLGSWGESTERGVPGAGRFVGTFCGRAWVRSGPGCYNGRHSVLLNTFITLLGLQCNKLYCSSIIDDIPCELWPLWTLGRPWPFELPTWWPLLPDPLPTFCVQW